jgi:hypothetical protein
MCIVIAGIGTACPTRHQLILSCDNNPDGFGWAIVSEGHEGKVLTMDKSMDEKSAIDGFLEAMAELGDSVVAWTFHARIMTHGKTSLANTHPFFIGDDELSVLAHNGILPVSIGKNDDRSDSKIFAEEYIPAIGGILGLNEKVKSELVEGFVYGSNSKIVVLTAHPDAEYALIIFGEASGHWGKGGQKDIWFSNHSYETEPYNWRTAGAVGNVTTRSIGSTTRYDEFTAGGFATDLKGIRANLLTKRELADAVMYTRCINNGTGPGQMCTGLIAEFDDICPTCDLCQQCEMDKLACQCWQPSMSARERANASAALAREEAF